METAFLPLVEKRNNESLRRKGGGALELLLGFTELRNIQSNFLR